MIVVLSQTGLKDSTAVLKDGDCYATRHTSIWLHLLINVLSTSLLGANIYFMQCLLALTRNDIDKAHS